MIRAERGGGFVTGKRLIDPRGEIVPFQFGTRYGPIRTRGARGHGVMPGAGTFLHRLTNQNVERSRHGVMPVAGTFLQ